MLLYMLHKCKYTETVLQYVYMIIILSMNSYMLLYITDPGMAI